MAHRPIATLLVLLLAACGSETGLDAPRGSISVVDSAGIQVVESTGPRYPGGLQYRVATAPSLSIGSVEDPDQVIGAVQDALRLTDGRILVLDRMTQEILVFDPDGRRSGTWGRRGQGPGEFGLAMALVRLPGDSIAVPDIALRRTTVLDPAGNVVRTFRNDFDFDPRSEQAIAAQSCCLPVGAVSSDVIVWRYPRVWSSAGSGRRAAYSTVVISAESATDTVGVFPAGTADEWPGGVSSIVSERFGPTIRRYGQELWIGT